MNHMPTVRQIVESWIHVSPDLPLIRLTGDDGAATARGSFLGSDTTDPAATGKAIYTELQNLPTAVASILNHTQNRANFHPASTPADDLIKYFSNYAVEIDRTPFFKLLDYKRDKQKFYSKDYNLLIDQVVKLFDGISTGDKDEIKTSIADMAKSVFGQQKAERWKNLFSQSTLDLSDLDNPKFYIYYTSLYMYHETKGKAEISQQDYEVVVASYSVLPQLIEAYADQLVSLDQTSVDDWLGTATSPEREDAQLCFRPRLLKKAS